jgi:hypothetical protein
MELRISTIPSPEDPPWRSVDYQSELRELGAKLRADGLAIREVNFSAGCSDCPPAVSGEWRVPLDAALAPVLEAPLGSWLQARHGRTARLRIGEIEADVRNVQELARVIRVAKCYQDVTEGES